MFSYQTGKCLHTSSKGNNYQMIVHEIYGNSTWIDPMENIIKGEMILSQRRAILIMKLQGIVSKNQARDNKISTAYKTEIQATHMTYLIVPPDDHHRNIAEKSIQTWKYHFVGFLTRTAFTLPMHLWCQ